MGSNIYFMAVLPNKKGNIAYKSSGKAKFSPLVIKKNSLVGFHINDTVFSSTFL